jgi:UDP-N-acetylmuramoyl-tripeptide--D-alanyl-D-alanine ligase
MITSFPYSLSTILAVLTENNAERIESIGFFSSISNSSMECKVGSLFVPLKDRRDGHDFIKDALERGASGFLCERNHPILKTLTDHQRKKAIFVKDTLQSLGKLANFHRLRFQPILIAITGSSGKTSTKELIGNLFRYLSKKEVVITEKNYNNEIGVPFTLLRINEFTKVVVCEMGMNKRGEIERLSKIAQPDIALITNIGSAHVENLKSPQTIAEEKSDIVLGMKKGSHLFAPQDVHFASVLARKAKQHGVHFTSWEIGSKSPLKIESESTNGFKLKFHKSEILWQMPGKTLLSNVRGMIAVGQYLKVSNEKIAEAIKTYRAPDKRLNIKKSYFQIIDDSYNANPESMLSSIQASIQVAGKKPLVWILGSMKELGKFSKHYHEMIGEVLKQYPNHTLITFGKDAEWIAKKRKIGTNYSYPDGFYEFEIFVDQISKMHPKGTTVLIKGSRSMKMERIVDAFLSFKT